MKLLRVLKPGPLTTIQDSGRRGFQKHGLAQGGAADRHAFLWANKLLDNCSDDACLELVFGGFEAEALTDMTVAVTGAAQEILVNGRIRAGWRTVRLARGDHLAVPAPRHGRFSYLAFVGGVQAEPLFGSRSVVIREQISGLAALTVGDTVSGEAGRSLAQRVVPGQYQRRYRAPVLCRVMPGYQYAEFSEADLTHFFNGSYQVSHQSDRMGFRLTGAPLASPPPGITSEGIAYGSIQVPGDGDPIVLLNDRQTIGGYPKIGVVSSQDCSRLAQALPGQDVRFSLTSLEAMQSEWLVFERFFQVSQWNETGDQLTWA